MYNGAKHKVTSLKHKITSEGVKCVEVSKNNLEYCKWISKVHAAQLLLINCDIQNDFEKFSYEEDGIIIRSFSEDCKKCGACCVWQLVLLTPNDDGIDEKYTQYTEMHFVDWESTRKMRLDTESGACSALRGAVGIDCECEIYDKRPAMCRTFRPGSHYCRAVRRTLEQEKTMACGTKHGKKSKTKSKKSKGGA